MPGWSCTPSRLALTPQIHTASTASSTPKAAAITNGGSQASTASGSAASVPKVPGAFGASPLPKPKASRWNGSRNTVRASAMSIPEMIPAAALGPPFAAIRIEDPQAALGGDAADDAHPAIQPLHRLEAFFRHSEAEFVIVAAGKHVFRRFFGMIRERGGDRQARDLDARTRAARFENMAEIGQQAIGDVDHRGRDAGKRPSRAQPRLGAPEPPHQRMFVIGACLQQFQAGGGIAR